MAKVLVVEDDVDIRALVVARLRGAGHKVIAAANGGEAVAVVTGRGRPDVAVLDIGLPGADGFEVLADLRHATGASDLPAVFLSARVQQADIDRGRSMGAYYLTKPFVASALLSTVERALPKADTW